MDGAGGVECFLRAADRQSGEQDSVFVTVAGGGVDREAEGVGRAAVAEPEQRDLAAVAEHAGDVGEAAVVLARTLRGCPPGRGGQGSSAVVAGVGGGLVLGSPSRPVQLRGGCGWLLGQVGEQPEDLVAG